MTAGKQRKKKAQPQKWPCLLLILCLSLILAILGSQAAEYLLSFRRETVKITAQITRSLPAEDDPAAGKINVNTASAADFQRAEGVGPVLAQAIVEKRDQWGGFFFLEELMDVTGIGEKRFEALKKLFYCPVEYGPAE